MGMKALCQAQSRRVWQHKAPFSASGKGGKESQFFGEQEWGLGEAAALPRGSATSQQLSPGKEGGHGIVFLLPVCGCFPTPPFVQTHPRCHGERHPLLSRVTATTLLGLEPAQPKGRLILPWGARLCRVRASREGQLKSSAFSSC